jgi:hypothetical protein
VIVTIVLYQFQSGLNRRIIGMFQALAVVLSM